MFVYYIWGVEVTRGDCSVYLSNLYNEDANSIIERFENDALVHFVSTGNLCYVDIQSGVVLGKR